MEVRVNAQLIQQIINTLKGIKVRGYDSMDKLVGLVLLFQELLNNAEPIPPQQPIDPTPVPLEVMATPEPVPEERGE